MSEGNSFNVDNILTTVNDSTPIQVFLGVVTAIVIILIIAFFKYMIYRIKRNKKASPYLLKGSVAGNKSKIIYQDPNNSESVPILRSRDENGGIEFTYTIWLYVNDWVNYKTGLWKHVFHKGSSNSFPPPEHSSQLGATSSTSNNNGYQYAMIAAPGLWFHPNTNSLRLYMNTFKNMNEYIDIGNIPTNKWYHLTIVVKETSLNLYVNGFLKQKNHLSSLPRQNFGNAYIGLNGGFSGFVADLKYHNYALSAAQVLKSVGNPPTSITCTDSSDNSPPYLDTNWWQNKYN